MASGNNRRIAGALSTLAHHGYLPALYRVPHSQTLMEKKFIAALAAALEGIGSDLLPELEGRKPATPEMLFGIVTEEFARRDGAIAAAYKQHIALALDRGLKNGAKQVGISMDWGLKDPNVRRVIEERAFVASQKTTETMIGDVKGTLLKGWEEGKGSDMLAKDLGSCFKELKGPHLEMIARTEVGSAQNEGTMMSYEKAAVEQIQWLATLDDRTRGNKPSDRANHLILHGVVVKLGEKFSNGLRFPGDKLGPIEEWIACRCGVRAVPRAKSFSLA